MALHRVACPMQRISLSRRLLRGAQLAARRSFVSPEESTEPAGVRRERARRLLLKQAADEACKHAEAEDMGFTGDITEHDVEIAHLRKERLLTGLHRQAEAVVDPCRVIDGRRIASDVRDEVKRRVSSLTARGLPPPGLAVVHVGNRKDSRSYVKAKEAACIEVGIKPTTVELPEDSSVEEVLARIDELNNDEAVDGILLQLPLPGHLDSQKIIQAIDYKKDVDGLHPQNLGLIAQGSKEAMVPCTPKGCMEILRRRGVDLPGKLCAVIGASNIVGLPMALLLLRANATVEILHVHTGSTGFGLGIGQSARLADVLIACCGVPRLVTSRFLKPGGVVIDVGVNLIKDSSKKSGFRMVGDVAFEDCMALSAQATPVPGGVGPMTVAMLTENVLIASAKRHGISMH